MNQETPGQPQEEKKQETPRGKELPPSRIEKGPNLKPRPKTPGAHEPYHLGGDQPASPEKPQEPPSQKGPAGGR